MTALGAHRLTFGYRAGQPVFENPDLEVPPVVHAPPRRPGRPRPHLVLRDGLLGALAQPVATLTVALVVASVCLVVLLTTGRSAATEREVVSSLDSVGTRLVTVTDTRGTAGIEPSAVADVAALVGVEWAFGLGPATDTHNADLPVAGVGTPMRALVGDLPPTVELLTGRDATGPGEAVVGSGAFARLRMGDSVGTATDGTTRVGVVGQVHAEGALAFLDDLVLYRPMVDVATTAQDLPVRYLYVLVEDAAAASGVADAITAVLRAQDPAGVEVSTSDGVLRLREVVAGSLGAGSRQLMAGVLGGGLVLVTTTVLGAVAGRRRDFGRRRALGASRSAIVVLVLVQTGVAASVGAVLGTGAGLVAVDVLTGSLPAPAFTAGVAALALLVALVGSVPPALAAASRDPVRILRVP
ncbi:FtsX-like permease family protein [Cellulomonas sp. P22]|uniref:FtsX-like permease family protein n=1 Tax=Cellulomonas sp. P22 TaxID=3373189 RepID=UPI0037917AF8